MHQQNCGPATARNVAARIASRQWSAFLDADDVWVPEKLQRQLQAADDCNVVYSDRLNIGDCKRVSGRLSDLGPLPTGDLFEKLLVENCVTLSSLLIRKSVFNELGGFDEDADLFAVEDWEFLLRCAAAGHRFAVCPDALGHYRWHQQQISLDHGRLRRRRLAVVRRAFQLPKAQLLSRKVWRKAMASAWRTSAWNLDEFNCLMAALWYAWSFRYEPFSPSTYRQIVNCCLGRY